MIKILVTVGPNSLNSNDLDYFSKHTVLFRLNGSHADLAWHEKAIKEIRRSCPKAFILMDLPGIKPRTANIDSISIEDGQLVCFGKEVIEQEHLSIKLTKTLPNYPDNLRYFSVNDGQFSFDVTQRGSDFITGVSRSKFNLLPKKGLNLPGSIYDEEGQLKIYQEFCSKIEHFDIDGLGLSFVQTGELAKKMRQFRPDLVMISKVENSEGLRNISNIAENSDAIMIDRGDLAAEVGLHKLYEAVETIASETKAMGKPLIMATENLESMTSRLTPSKSEVMSLGHSISIGADCVMLSEETAVSDNSNIIISWLKDFCENSGPAHIKRNFRANKSRYNLIWNSLEHFSSVPKIVFSKSGYAIFDFFSVEPHGHLFLVAEKKKVFSLCGLYKNKIELIDHEISDTTTIESVWNVIEKNKSKLFQSADQIVAIYVSRYVNSPRANCITVFDKKDFYSQD